MTPEQIFRYILVYRALHKGLLGTTNGAPDPYGLATIPQVPNKSFIADSGLLFLNLLFAEPNDFWENLNQSFINFNGRIDATSALSFYEQYRRQEFGLVNDIYDYWSTSNTTAETQFVRNALQYLLDKGVLRGWIEGLKHNYQETHRDRKVLNEVINPQDYPLVNPITTDSYEVQTQNFLNTSVNVVQAL